ATSEGPRAKWEELLEKQVPFLYKFVVQIKSKIKKTPKAKASVETEGEAPKKKIKPIHIIIIGALIFLFYDELTKEPEPEVVEPVTETKVEKNEPSTAPTPPSEETAEPVEIAEPTETT